MQGDFALASNLLANDRRLLKSRVLWGETPLHYLAVENRLRAAKWLISRGANVNARDKYGEPILVSVCSVGLTSVARLLIRCGAKIEARGRVYGTALCAAAGSSEARAASVVKLLIRAGANLEARSPISRETPMHQAVEAGNLSAVAHLLKAGASIRSRNAYGETPVQAFGESATPAMLRLLARHRSLLNERDWREATLLHTAAYHQLPGVVRYLLKQGADPFAKDRDGWLPVHEALRGYLNLATKPSPADPPWMPQIRRHFEKQKEKPVAKSFNVPGSSRPREQLSSDHTQVLKLLAQAAAKAARAKQIQKKRPARSQSRATASARRR